MLSQVVFKNEFGVITPDKVVLLQTPQRAEIPLDKIVAVHMKRERNQYLIVGGCILVVYSLLRFMEALQIYGLENSLKFILMAIAGLIVVIAHWIGHFVLEVKTASEPVKSADIQVSKKRQGVELKLAIQNAGKIANSEQ
jgi:hypothetical protein